VIDEFASRFVYFYTGYLLAPRIFAFAQQAQTFPEAALALLGAGQFHARVTARGPAAHHGVGHFRVELNAVCARAVAEGLDRKRVAFGDEIEIRQGAEIQRPSLLRARVTGSADRVERVEVAGSAVIVARGEFHRY